MITITETEWDAIINEDARYGIYQYCKSRKYKCSTCRLSIKKYTDKASEYATCIFANCPCSWYEEDEI